MSLLSPELGGQFQKSGVQVVAQEIGTKKNEDTQSPQLLSSVQTKIPFIDENS